MFAADIVIIFIVFIGISYFLVVNLIYKLTM